MTDGTNNDVDKLEPWGDCYGRSCVDITVCRTEPTVVTQPCGICGYIASHDTTYIDRDGKEVRQCLCNDCAPELAKNFKFVSVKEI